jgi:hypothetical protein
LLERNQQQQPQQRERHQQREVGRQTPTKRVGRLEDSSVASGSMSASELSPPPPPLAMVGKQASRQQQTQQPEQKAKTQNTSPDNSGGEAVLLSPGPSTTASTGYDVLPPWSPTSPGSGGAEAAASEALASAIKAAGSERPGPQIAMGAAPPPPSSLVLHGQPPTLSTGGSTKEWTEYIDALPPSEVETRQDEERRAADSRELSRKNTPADYNLRGMPNQRSASQFFAPVASCKPLRPSRLAAIRASNME